MTKNQFSATARTSSESGTSSFCNHLSIISSHYASKMYFKYPKMKLVSLEITRRNENLSSCAHVLHITAQYVIFPSRKGRESEDGTVG